MSTDRTGGSITLDQWIGFNDEMVALVRAGMPLDRGLVRIGEEMGGSAGGLAWEVGQALEEGASLDQAIAANGAALPPIYRAVVAAGLRSGRLTQALEAMAVFTRGVAETRRAIGAALCYPLIVLTTAYALFVLYVAIVLPRFQATFTAFRLAPGPATRLLNLAAEHVWWWAPIVPLMLVTIGIAWVVSNRASSVRPGGIWGVFRFVPGLGPVYENAQAAALCEVLSMLVEHGVPMDESLALAAKAAGRDDLILAAERLADAVRRGETLSAGFYAAPGPFPPLLRWVLATAPLQADLAKTLRHVGRTYRLRARNQTEAIAILLPGLMLLLLGTSAAVVYALTVFGPLVELWMDLGAPINY